MIREVRVARTVFELANERFGSSRTARGAPSEYDFVGGPLAAAVFAFRGFDQLPYEVLPAVRTYTIIDPFFGVLLFVGVLVEADVVEIATFADDPDYWSVVDEEPE